MQKEIWKDVIGWEGLYSISNKGNFKRLSKTIKRSNGVVINLKEKLIKGWKNDDGYINVELNINNKSKKVQLSRLVAQSFVDNPENLPQVNHIDGNKTNNNYLNLEWVTSRENNCHRVHKTKKHSKYIGVTLRSKQGLNKTRGKKKWVATITINCKLINLGYFESEEEAYMCRVNYEKNNNIKNRYL